MLQAGNYGGFIRPAPVQSRRHLIKITVLAAAFLLSVVLNNVALRFIPVSFVEVKSSHSEMLCFLNCHVAKVWIEPAQSDTFSGIHYV